jgi:very-short-patch-repair endonuclease
MRSAQTPAESRLWQALRARRLDGLKVRRQVPIWPFIADFIVASTKLVIELDGSQHDGAKDYDDDRTRWFESQGYHVLRFWNREVMDNLDGVLHTIVHAARPLSPLAVGESPSPQREREA